MGKGTKVGSKVKGIIGSILPFIYAISIQLIVLLIGSIVYGMILGVKLALEGMTPDEIAIISSEKVQEGNFVLVISAISAVVWIIVYGIWYKRSFVRNRKVQIKNIFNLKSFIWLTLLGIGLQISLAMILNIIMSASPELQKSYESVMNALGMGNSLISFAYIVLIAPVAEELIFRGVIFEKSRKVLPFVYANILQALLFGIMHMNIVQSSYAFVLGLFLGLVCYKKKSILPAIYLHFVINLAGVLPSILFSNEDEITSPIFIAALIMVAIISTIMVVVSTFKICREKSTEEMETDIIEMNDSEEEASHS